MGTINMKVMNAAVINADSILVGADYGFNILSLEGQIKQTISFEESEGKQKGMHINGNYLVAWTFNSYFSIYAINNKSFKAIMPNRKFEDSRGLLGEVRSCAVSLDGTKIGITFNSLVNGVSSASNKFAIFDTELDSFQTEELGPEKVPISFFWDKKDKRFFGVQIEYMKSGDEIKVKEELEEEETENEK